ncbi:tyrosine-type recombinase/integrase [[Mycoplasma] anseris]|uniref:Tyr recombinase domain-containing protein n=1 Tax=[Mycoplasma] anseris TaxID=92400 RepID=A0A2Z4NDQ7_9BACT|nr:tyrosine-type recombinase/integrase [[Mycoplasma] anseris]AWX69690.1 hypothetical protein DP065_02965 [[Mycoplasma] anseris]
MEVLKWLDEFNKYKLNQGKTKAHVNSFGVALRKVDFKIFSYEEINEAINKLNLNNSTKNTYLIRIKAFLKFCFKNGFIKKFDLTEIITFKQVLKINKHISNDKMTELINLLNTFDKKQSLFTVYFHIIKANGLRMGEIYNLPWDLIKSKVSQALENNEANDIIIEFFPLKGNNKRLCIIPAYLFQAIKRNENKVLTRIALKSRFDKFAQYIKTQDDFWKEVNFTTHKLRKYFITQGLNKNISVERIAQITGHKNVGTILKHYYTRDDKEIANLINVINNNDTAKEKDNEIENLKQKLIILEQAAETFLNLVQMKQLKEFNNEKQEN